MGIRYDVFHYRWVLYSKRRLSITHQNPIDQICIEVLGIPYNIFKIIAYKAINALRDPRWDLCYTLLSCIYILPEFNYELGALKHQKLNVKSVSSSIKIYNSPFQLLIKKS